LSYTSTTTTTSPSAGVGSARQYDYLRRGVGTTITTTAAAAAAVITVPVSSPHMSALASTSTEFVDSAACGDLDGVKACLSDPSTSSACINLVDKDGRSAFHYGCLNDDVPLLTVLFSDSRVDTSLRTPNSDTPLHLASLYAALGAMKMLIDNGCDIDAQNKYLETPLHLVAGSGDKGAVNAANILLSRGASMSVADKWGRGCCDVSRDNSENPLVKVFTDFLSGPGGEGGVREEVKKLSEKYKEKEATPVYTDEANKNAKAAILGALGGGGGVGGGAGGLLGGLKGIKLKKTTTNHRTMFSGVEGKVKDGSNQAGKAGEGGAKTGGRRALSKLIDFPGNKEEIATHLEDPKIDPAGKDYYHLTALHKFASWNKTEFIEMILPKLTKDEIMATDKEGKTALHWAVEMAAVASVKALVAAGVDVDAKDNKGRTVMEVLDAAAPTGIIDRLKKVIEENK